MDMRHFTIAAAIALLTVTPAAAKEPAAPATADKSPRSKVEQPDSLGTPETPVKLAEASKADEPAAPKRRRAARVTTCRCGDPSVQ